MGIYEINWYIKGGILMEIKNVILEEELKNVTLEKDGNLAIITINRPKALNAFSEVEISARISSTERAIQSPFVSALLVVKGKTAIATVEAIKAFLFTFFIHSFLIFYLLERFLQMNTSTILPQFFSQK